MQNLPVFPDFMSFVTREKTVELPNLEGSLVGLTIITPEGQSIVPLSVDELSSEESKFSNVDSAYEFTFDRPLVSNEKHIPYIRSNSSSLDVCNTEFTIITNDEGKRIIVGYMGLIGAGLSEEYRKVSFDDFSKDHLNGKVELILDNCPLHSSSFLYQLHNLYSAECRLNDLEKIMSMPFINDLSEITIRDSTLRNRQQVESINCNILFERTYKKFVEKLNEIESLKKVTIVLPIQEDLTFDEHTDFLIEECLSRKLDFKLVCGDSYYVELLHNDNGTELNMEIDSLIFRSVKHETIFTNLSASVAALTDQESYQISHKVLRFNSNINKPSEEIEESQIYNMLFYCCKNKFDEMVIYRKRVQCNSIVISLSRRTRVKGMF